jgi:hypothetical protein
MADSDDMRRRLEIEEVKARYVYSIATKDWEGFGPVLSRRGPGGARVLHEPHRT